MSSRFSLLLLLLEEKKRLEENDDDFKNPNYVNKAKRILRPYI